VASDLAGRFEQAVNLEIFVFFVIGSVFALANLRGDRGDRRGAMRLAIFTFAVCLLTMLMSAHHTFTIAEEARRTFSAVAYAATRALLTWLLYLAMEPFIRRLHPSSLVSWSRLLTGRFRDPAVGRDLLIGLALTALPIAVLIPWLWARGWHGAFFPALPFLGGDHALSTREALATMLRHPVVSIGDCLGLVLVYAVLGSLAGRARIVATALLWLAMFLYSYGLTPLPLEVPDQIVIGLLFATAWTILVVRFGLLAYVCASTCLFWVQDLIPTTDPSDWYATPILVVSAALIGLVIFAVRTSTQGAPLFTART
jgi:hypothetical protein